MERICVIRTIPPQYGLHLAYHRNVLNKIASYIIFNQYSSPEQAASRTKSLKQVQFLCGNRVQAYPCRCDRASTIIQTHPCRCDRAGTIIRAHTKKDPASLTQGPPYIKIFIPALRQPFSSFPFPPASCRL